MTEAALSSSESELALAAKAPEGVAAIDRAMRILFAFRADDRGLTLAQLAHRTGLYKSTILRLSASLCQHQMLVRHDDGRYYVGPAALRLGALYQRGLQLGEVVLPRMRAMRDQCAESVSFYVPRDALRVCLHRVDSTHAIRDHVREGDVLPMGIGSGGRVLSAFSGEPGALYDRIRAQGYYLSEGERDAETGGLSVPVFAAGERLVGALTVAGPRSRVTIAWMQSWRLAVLSMAIDVSEQLGAQAESLREAWHKLKTSAGH